MTVLKSYRPSFYESGLGTRPVREWLLGLSAEDRKLVGRDIQKVEYGCVIFCVDARAHGAAARLHSDLKLALKRMKEVL